MARARRETQERARQLRSQGLSLRDIATEVGAALSSVSVWVRDVPLTEAQARRLHPPGRAERSQPAPRVAPEGRRTCGRCAAALPFSAFSRDGDGWQSWCKACFKAYFDARRPEHQAFTRDGHKRRRAAAAHIVDEIKRTAACADCGMTESACLEFDHVGAKTADVSLLRGAGARPDRLLQEIRACDIACASCHRRRTAARRNASKPARERAAHLDAGRRRNARLVRVWAAALGCADCDERDPVVLEYDHVDGKTDLVSKLAHHGVRIGRLFEEMLRCEIRCANCHRLRHHHERRASAA